MPQQNFYLGGDGNWHVFNPITKTWHKQETVIHIINLKKPVPSRKKSVDIEINQKEKTPGNKSIETKNTDVKKEESKDGIKEVSPKESDLPISPLADSKVEEDLKKKRKMGENLDKILTDDQIVYLVKIERVWEDQEEKRKAKGKKKEKVVWSKDKFKYICQW